ncbi:MAG: F0F1 ATP synthase subunit A [Methylomonas sp.]|jgi:F-type H+-transporting ATPase subunit a|uniref:F0F1 ATP synthase subunit A n=1 Tax=Methylomonas sp. TaxID=418 RepID=UPI0025FEAA0E|nr:F0F1 ATP synthase subunit A [Methylomonas sp.]MCK9607077.1 F0F1 ATP synthase subunit A [Methylomonas sp.]
MTLSPDDHILGWIGPLPINATIAYTWLVMAILVTCSYLVTRRLNDSVRISRWQNLLEILVSGLSEQIRQTSRQEPGPYLPFVGTLFLFIATANLLAVVPGFSPPTASLSCTTALALAVLAAVPLFGIAQRGLLAYLGEYIKPSVFMLPFNIIGELSRTLALAVRLYGNMMSGSVIGIILLGIVPLFFPILLQFLGLITGLVQAYIFAVLAMVFIASAQAARNDRTPNPGD